MSKTVKSQQTPLHFAAKTGSLKIIDCLVKVCHANVEDVDYQGRTPLYIAAEHGKIE
jgi:ankyrin repeat protein